MSNLCYFSSRRGQALGAKYFHITMKLDQIKENFKTIWNEEREDAF